MGDKKAELEAAEASLAIVEVKLKNLEKEKCALLAKIANLKAIQTHQDVDFPWSSKLDEVLETVFRLSCLRPIQRQAINATLSKKDCLLMMPSGGGESLCFQLPALIDKGLTLVVSPLLSIMEDQQIALEHLKIRSAVLSAATGEDRLKYVQNDMVKPNGELKIVYVTPEKLAKSKLFMNNLEKCYQIGHLARIVIDEVHCCSHCGHDFRPDYKFLSLMKRQFPYAPILGLTATATIKVLEDVKKILSIPKALLFKASFNRPNLYFEVCEKPGSQKDFMDVIHRIISHRFSGQSGIVYCIARKDSEEVTTDLQARGIKAGCYNADVDAKSRSMVHRRWLAGEIQVVVATGAFGMGMDKPDVRFVIHHSLSKSMENMYQESGRAGRDGLRSSCLLFYRLSDVVRITSMIFTDMRGLQNLHSIVKYCIDVGSCRRSLLACHFGEEWDRSQCMSMCDNCDKARNTGSIEHKDVTEHCVNVLSLLKEAADTDQRMTTAKLVEAWYGRGHASLKVKNMAVPTFKKETAERILAHMLINDYLQEDFHFTAYATTCYIKPGTKANLLTERLVSVIIDIKAKSPDTTSAKSSSSAITPSASSDNSSAPLLKNRDSFPVSKAEKTKEKPRLVFMNKTEVSEKDSLNFDDSDEESEERPQKAQKNKREIEPVEDAKKKRLSSNDDFKLDHNKD